jgi:hypothetical protein
MKSQSYNKDELYPEEFDDDDKIQFDYYLEQSKLVFPKMANEEWLLKMGIKAYMLKQKKGIDTQPTEEEIAEIRNQYSNDTVYYTEPIEVKE